MRIALLVEYDGTAYHGWQIQPGEETIQGTLEHALEALMGEQIRLHGSGRTDSGVHARAQIAHFEIAEPKIPAQKIKDAVKRHLSDDIRVHASGEVTDNFHARFDANGRHYSYQITSGSPVLERYHTWATPYQLDSKALVACSRLIPGNRDFSSFCQAQTETENKICEVKEATWEYSDKSYRFHIKADRFLHHMVRMLVGSMVEVARGKWELQTFKSLLHTPDPQANTITAPPHGLVLEAVYYPDSVELPW